MGFYYFREKNKFMRNWIQTAQKYREAGMDCAQINAMFDFEWSIFKQERVNEQHKQYTTPLEFWYTGEDESKLSYCLDKRSTQDEYFQNAIYINESLEMLCPGVSSQISEKDKTLLILLSQGYTQAETAVILGISQQAVSKHLQKIKKSVLRGL